MRHEKQTKEWGWVGANQKVTSSVREISNPPPQLSCQLPLIGLATFLTFKYNLNFMKFATLKYISLQTTCYVLPVNVRRCQPWRWKSVVWCMTLPGIQRWTCHNLIIAGKMSAKRNPWPREKICAVSQIQLLMLTLIFSKDILHLSSRHKLGHMQVWLGTETTL